MLHYAVAFFQFICNFMDPLPCRQTPAMIEEITTNVWTWEQFISYHHTI